MKKTIVSIALIGAFSSQATIYNALVSKEHHKFGSTDEYTIVKDNPPWTTLSSYCLNDIEPSDIYTGYTEDQTTDCYDEQERYVTTKKVFSDGSEEIISTDKETRDHLTSSTTQTITGTHIEESCNGILNFNPDFRNQDGNYPALVAGVQGMTIICDMTTDGGGWTKVAKVDNNISVVESSSWLSTGHFLGANSGSMAVKYFNASNPEAILFVNKAPSAAAGKDDLIVVERTNATWGWTVSNFNNNKDQTARFYDASTGSWTNLGTVSYAAHAGSPWQDMSFSFTRNNVNNGYSGEFNNRLILGPTTTVSGNNGYWLNFYGNAESDANTWAASGQGAGEVWMK